MTVETTGRAMRGLHRFGLAFAAWTLLGVFDASQTYMRHAYLGRPMGWFQALALGLCLWYAWAVLAVFVFQLARRYPLDAQHWPRHLPLHAVASCFFAMVKLVMDYPIIGAFYRPEPELVPFIPFYRTAFVGYFHHYVLIYWSMLGVAHAFNYQRKWRQRTLKALQLEARLSQAQLQMLELQLQPHFLFNTLNGISTLIHRDPDLADRMLCRLGDLLRRTLDHAGTQEVALGRELEFLQAYLEIEQLRFGPRLHVQIRVDEEVAEARVPYLILQPLVENAIRHGLAPSGRAGVIEVRAHRCEGGLRLQVSDTGVGVPEGMLARLREGIGLSNTRARLKQLYGNDHRLELRHGHPSGLVVTIDVPLRLTGGDNDTLDDTPALPPFLRYGWGGEAQPEESRF
jgi:two-component system, LytTR family, sensor kinase